MSYEEQVRSCNSHSWRPTEALRRFDPGCYFLLLHQRRFRAFDSVADGRQGNELIAVLHLKRGGFCCDGSFRRRWCES